MFVTTSVTAMIMIQTQKLSTYTTLRLSYTRLFDNIMPCAIRRPLQQQMIIIQPELL